MADNRFGGYYAYFSEHWHRLLLSAVFWYFPTGYGLSDRLDHTFVCCNQAGKDAHFVKEKIVPEPHVTTVKSGYVRSLFRGARDKVGSLMYASEEQRRKKSVGLSVSNVKTGSTRDLYTMRIFFDHQTFTQQTYGGISRYFCELINGINKSEKNHAHLSLLWSNNVHLKEYNIPTLPYLFTKRHRLFQLSNQLYNQIDFKIDKFDLYHATYFDNFLMNYKIQKPCVATFYDMTYERLSNRFSELSEDKSIIQKKKIMAQKATHLIAISDSTKKDMIELLEVESEKISVIHLASSFLPNNTIDSDDLLIRRPYLLYVGKRDAYKNFIPFLKAIAHILTKYKIELVCAGGGLFTTYERDTINVLSLNNLVKHKPINDDLLKVLYRDALAFAFPSLYEGFGIPVLEAFACNCPCVISGTSSLPEVAGDAALYFNPEDSESMAHNVESIILSNSLRSELKLKGKQRLLSFSWQQTVEQTLNLYESLS